MRRLLWPLFWFVELPIAIVGAMLLLAWFWSASDQSLATALRLAGRYLPAGHSLVAQDVQGSLRQGGKIGVLRWENNGLTVQARQVELTWRPVSLLERRLQLDALQVGQLEIDYQSSAAGAPLDELVWPFAVDARFTIDALRWKGPPAVQASRLAGRYQFDRKQHALTLDRAQVAAGNYQAEATLQARAPMALDLLLKGKLQTPVAGRSIALDATASLRGPLAGPAVVLDLLAQLRPVQGTAQARAPVNGMSAKVAAKIDPWATQPVLQAQVEVNQFNLAVVWPQAPQTLLTGNAQVQPQGSGWQAKADLRNTLAGPWDKDRLPVDSAKALVQYAAGRWTIQSLDAESAGGRVRSSGALPDTAFGPASGGWQGQAQLLAINPAALHSRLAPARLDGEVRASAVQQTIEFDAVLKPSGPQPAGSPLQGLRLQNALAKGRWAEGWLQLQTLNIQTDDARLQGQIDLQPSTMNARGQLQLSVPGAEAKASGQLGPAQGAGDFSLQVADASRAARWVTRLPHPPAALEGTQLAGRGDVTLRWQGGWQAFLDASLAEPVVRATLHFPQLDLRLAGQPVEQTVRLREFHADASGRLGALVLATRTEVIQGPLRAQLQMQAQGGRSAANAWKLAVDMLRVQAHTSQYPRPWVLNLRQPLSLAWQTVPSGGTLLAGPGSADLTGPLPGTATLDWEPVRWSSGLRNEVVSKGQLRGLGLDWLDLLGGAQFGNLGLSGNMVFDGDWDLAATDTFKLRAALFRRSGDIRILADTRAGSATPAGPVIDAGVKDARLTLTADGNALRAALLWDSEHAGNAQAEFSTRVTRGASGWELAADAPLSGSVRARLPQVGVWSVLAPPGWRMRGTLDANMALAGTRAQPQWSGNLQADDLGLRSVVDGIEFGNGRLRAGVVGQRLEITEFSLLGAGGAAGGKLSATGFALWLPDGSGAYPAFGKVRIELDATASALRVSARADRRLVVSGTLQARLNNARLEIRGALKADQALFVLPDENAPSLGDDVVVRRTSAAATAAAGSADRGVAAASAVGAGPRAPVSTSVAVELDLGPDFRVQGRGINTRLAGTLQLRSTADPNAAPRLTGEVRTVQGSYKAYGQQLDIQQGVMRFLGPYDNPALEILAIRPNLSQRVGVQITGTVLAPRVRLYSDPELPEVEKLAWLVLGRSGANGGAEAAVLQQAALALLGSRGQGNSGSLANRLGLDELSFAAATSKADGTTTAATVMLGKRLSSNFYVAYERSLAGTLGTLSFFYDLSQRFTLRARTGAQSAIDLIFTYRYD